MLTISFPLLRQTIDVDFVYFYIKNKTLWDQT